MPKKAVSTQERMDLEFQVALAAGQTRLGERDADTAQIMPNCRAVYYKRKKEPGTFTIRDLRILAKRYQFTDYQLCQIFGVEYHGRTTESEAV